MLAGALHWWFARLNELMPGARTSEAARLRKAIVIEADGAGHVIASIQARGGRQQIVALGTAVRLAGRKPVLVRPPPGAVLVKHHSVPITPRRQLPSLLQHELARITPFRADQVFWRWDCRATQGDRRRMQITLTMVPKVVLNQTLMTLDSLGLKVDALLAGSADQPALLPIGMADRGSAGTGWFRFLVGASIGLAAVALAVPVGRQAAALRETEGAISGLQPAVAEATALQRSIAAAGSQRDILMREAKHTGNVLQILATISRILPDNTYLTDFSLHERQITFSGRSASAARLVTALSVDSTIREVAFTAPVTRMEDAAFDIFSIRARLARP